MAKRYPRRSLSPSEVIRNPEKYKGLRQRFRTIINKNADRKFKYQTCLTRGKYLRVELRKGDFDTFTGVVETCFPDGKHEGFVIYVVEIHYPQSRGV